jgi:spore coat-associated protein N
VSEPDERRRSLRAFIVLLLTVLSTGVVGFGGLAVWTAVTQNDNSQFATGAIHHTNTATVAGGGSVTCNDSETLPATTCGMIFDLSGAVPGSSQQGGTVTITNTSTIPSTFHLSVVSAVTSGEGTTLCNSLVVTVTDSQVVPATAYSGRLATMPSVGLPDTNGSATWNQNDFNVFTFTLTLPSSSPTTDQNSRCTVSYRWTQSSA